MLLIPNPYHQLDAKGQLAGACPIVERLDRPAHRIPQRLFVGAKCVATNYQKRGDPGVTEFEPIDPRRPHLGRKYKQPGGGAGQLSRAELSWAFESKAVEVRVDGPSMEVYWQRRIRNGEVFEAKNGVAPIDAIRAARSAAIAHYRDHNDGADPPFALWAKQFTLDAEFAADDSAKSLPSPKPTKEKKD